MNLGTFEFDEKQLEWNTIKLKKDYNQLKEHLLQINRNNCNPKVIECINIIENTLLPTLEKYDNKMTEIIIETKKTKNETIE